MAVSIIWKDGSGTEISELNFGAVQNGDIYGVMQTIRISHDGSEPITDVAFYIQPYTGEYNGVQSPQADYDDLIAWGDGGDGLKVDQDVSASSALWSQIDSTQGTPTNPITLLGSTKLGGTGTDGQINAGDTHELTLWLTVPSGVSTPGARSFDFCLKYSYTS